MNINYFRDCPGAQNYKAVLNTVPTVKNVVLTEGGCCWLHAAISIQKQTPGDGKNVIMAALAAHPSETLCSC